MECSIMIKFKKMLAKINESLKLNYFVYKVIIIILSLIFLWMFGFKDYSVPAYGYDYLLIILTVIFCAWLILPRYLDKLVYIILLFTYSLYLISQEIYVVAFGQYYSFKTVLSLYKEAIGATSSTMEFVKIEHYMALISLMILIVLIIIIRDDGKTKWRIKMISSVIFIGISFLIISNRLNDFNDRLTATDLSKLTYNESDRYLYEKLPSSISFVNKFGIDAFLIKDISETFIVSINDNHEEKTAIIEDFIANNASDNMVNSTTGIFEGKNLIMIQGESLMNVAIDPILTPTLYKLRNEGLWFTEYGSPLLTGSTSDTEILAQMSIHPLALASATMNSYATNDFIVSLPKLFKTIGYSTSVYHNNYATYYNRSVFYLNNYYDTAFFSSDMGLENQTSDLITLEYASWILAEKDNFFSYLISYSGHQPYTIDSLYTDGLPEDTIKEYLDYISTINKIYPELSESMTVYLAKCMSLDRGVEKLMSALEVYGKLDDTVIVIFGDHHAKGLADNNDDLDGDLSILGKAECESVPLIIYNAQTTAQEIDKYCTSIDILPTLANMFNISYDSKYTFGFDIFDESYIGYRFDANGTIYSKDFTYDFETGLQITGDISAADAQAIVDYFINMKEASEYIIELDYFSKID